MVDPVREMGKPLLDKPMRKYTSSTVMETLYVLCEIPLSPDPMLEQGTPEVLFVVSCSTI